MQLTGTLDVDNKTTLKHDLSLNNRLFVNGDASFNGDVTIFGNLKADKINNEYIINTETTNYTLIVAEDLSLNNRLFIEGDASFNEDIYVKRNVNFDGTMNDITTSEFGYLDGVTGPIQTQLNNKQSTLKFGITNNDVVRISTTNTINTGNYARFTNEGGNDGIKGRTISQVKTDLSVDNVTNESKSTMFTNPTLTGNITMSGPTDYSGHLLPTANASYDIGSAEYKVRHLFLSDNSLWVGDEHKISVSQNKMSFKKRNKNVVPRSIIQGSNGLNENDIANQAITFVKGIDPTKTSIDLFTVNDWLLYAQQSGSEVNNKQGQLIDVSDIFDDNIETYDYILYTDIANNDLLLNNLLTVNGKETFNNDLDICGNLYLSLIHI